MFSFSKGMTNLFGFFKPNSLSDQLLVLLSPDQRQEDSLIQALQFINDHQNDPIDFYQEIQAFGYSYSALRLALINNPKELFQAMLNHPYMRTRKNHNNKILFDILVIIEVGSNPEMKELKPSFIAFIKAYVLSDNPEQENDALPELSSEQKIKPSDNFLKHFEKCPVTELWRLFYDADQQRKEYGWIDYEKREPGFLEGMRNAFLFLKKTIDQELTVNLLKNLHKLSTSNVNNLVEHTCPGKFRHNTEIGFGISSDTNSSLAGLIEMIETSNETKYHIDISTHSRVCCPARSNAEIEIDVEKTIRNYQENIQKSTDSRSKLFIIAGLVSELERIHPFVDGNCRVICTLLVIRELIHHGFPPVILDDPNKMGGYSKKQCVTEIIRGMNNFKAIMHGDHSQFGKATNEILSHIDKHEKKQYREIWETTCDIFKKQEIGAESTRDNRLTRSNCSR